MDANEAVVLFGHGARDPEWAGPMRRMQARIRAEAPALAVELAFMEFMQPTLEAVMDGLAARGVGAVTVVPVFLAQGGHLKRDVPLLVDAARERHPGCRIRLATAVGEDASVIAAVAAYALAAAGETGMVPER